MKRRRRTLFVLAGLTLLLVVAAVVGGGWYYAERIREGALEAKRSAPQLDLDVVALTDGKVTLRATEKTDREGD